MTDRALLHASVLTVDGEHVPAYYWTARRDEREPYELDGHRFHAAIDFRLWLLPDAVELRKMYLLSGDAAPKNESGCIEHPEEVIVTQSHAAFLADPTTIAEAGRAHFDEPRWDSALAKATEEGTWRAHLPIRNTAAQVELALERLKAGGVGLQTAAPYTSLSYFWDADAQTFIERSYTSHPYGGEDRSSEGPVSEAKVRNALQGIPYERYPEALRGP